MRLDQRQKSSTGSQEALPQHISRGPYLFRNNLGAHFQTILYCHKVFKETHIDALTEDDITSLHEDLNELEQFGFDLSCAHKRLNMMEKLKFRNDHDSLQQELMDIEESLEPLNKRLVETLQQFVKALTTFRLVLYLITCYS